MKPQLLTNLVPEVYQEELKQTVEEIPFYYTPSIGYNSTSLPTAGIKFLDNIGFSHGLVIEGQEDSMYWSLFRPILYFFTQKTGVKVNKVVRVRLRLTFQHPDRNEFLFNKLDKAYDDRISLRAENYRLKEQIKNGNGTDNKPNGTPEGTPEEECLACSA